jgi:hypothetical protein
MATPTGAQGFDKSADNAYTIIRPGVQTDHLLLTNAAGGGIAISTGGAITFPTTTPAAATTALSVYARSGPIAASFTGPFAAPVVGTLSIERIGNMVKMDVNIPQTATTSAAVIVVSPGPQIPAWARPSTSTTAWLSMLGGGTIAISLATIASSGAFSLTFGPGANYPISASLSGTVSAGGWDTLCYSVSNA